MTTICSFTALPDDVLQRVLVGVLLDDHPATAAACRAFRDVIRGPQFPALRRRYGFAERGMIFFGQKTCSATMEIHVAGKHGAMARIDEDLKLELRASTTDGGARLFVSTMRYHGAANGEVILAVNGSTRRWSRFATLPLHQTSHCIEWHAGLLYVAGGIAGSDTHDYLNTLHAFNETTGLWDDLPPMPHACASAASGVIGNQLFIAGGYYGDIDLSTLQIYDFITRTWRLGAPLPRTDWGSCGIVVGDGKLYLVSSRPDQTRNMLVYDVQSNTWTEQIPPPYGDGGAMHAFAHKSEIVVVKKTGPTLHRGTGSDPMPDVFCPFDFDGNGRYRAPPGFLDASVESVLLG